MKDNAKTLESYTRGLKGHIEDIHENTCSITSLIYFIDTKRMWQSKYDSINDWWVDHFSDDVSILEKLLRVGKFCNQYQVYLSPALTLEKVWIISWGVNFMDVGEAIKLAEDCDEERLQRHVLAKIRDYRTKVANEFLANEQSRSKTSFPPTPLEK